MLRFREALFNDVELYFRWANDAVVRQNSLNTKKINLEDHVTWFNRKIENPNVFMYLFLNEKDVPVGQVIIEEKEGWTSVGQSVAQEHRGKKYSTEMLTKATNAYLKKFPKRTIVSVVKSTNVRSLKMSVNSGLSVIDKDSLSENVLVLKGFQQHDESYIKKAKEHYNII